MLKTSIIVLLSFSLLLVSKNTPAEEVIDIGKKIQKKNKKPIYSIDEFVKNLHEKNEPNLILLLDKLPELKNVTLLSELKKLDQKKVKFEVIIDKKDYFIALLEFNKHKINLIGFNNPIPQSVVDKTIKPSYWKTEQKDKALDHKAHILLYYSGTEKYSSEKFISLYRVANAFYKQGLLGVVNEATWTFNPSELVPKLVSKELLEDIKDRIPSFLWKSIIKFTNSKGVWFVSKGNNYFGVPDFAYFGKHEEFDDVIENLDSIFNYAYKSKATIEAGHTIQIGKNKFFRFREVYEYPEYLESEMGTLVVEVITKEQINKN